MLPFSYKVIGYVTITLFGIPVPRIYLALNNTPLWPMTGFAHHYYRFRIYFLSGPPGT
jgi:hypothetical protein